MNSTKIRNQIRAALFAAIIAVLSIFTIPTPAGIPLTLQTFAVALSGFCLGRKYGIEAVIIYLTVGAIGLPIFSGMTGGLGKLFDVTGGYIFGFIPLAAMCTKNKSHLKNVLFSCVGLVLCHTVGIFWLSIIANTNPISAAITTSLPFLPKDILSIATAYGISCIISKRMRV